MAHPAHLKCWFWTANFSIDPMPSKYRASIADADTNTDTLKCPSPRPSYDL